MALQEFLQKHPSINHSSSTFLIFHLLTASWCFHHTPLRYSDGGDSNQYHSKTHKAHLCPPARRLWWCRWDRQPPPTGEVDNSPYHNKSHTDLLDSRRWKSWRAPSFRWGKRRRCSVLGDSCTHHSIRWSTRCCNTSCSGWQPFYAKVTNFENFGKDFKILMEEYFREG